MHRFTTFFLTTLIVCQAFYNAGVLGYWLVNRATIAATLCENRDKPELECDGKCYLKKKMAKAPESPPTNDGTEIPPLRKVVELAVTPNEAPILVLPTVSDEVPVLIPGLGNHRGLILEKSIFHPPTVQGHFST